MMLEPTMSDLLKTISNRYLLVNIAAKRARDIADAAEMAEEPLEDKPVKLALYDIGSVRCSILWRRPGPEPTRPKPCCLLWSSRSRKSRI